MVTKDENIKYILRKYKCHNKVYKKNVHKYKVRHYSAF